MDRLESASGGLAIPAHFDIPARNVGVLILLRLLIHRLRSQKK
jgi:hypothetical protein